MFPDKDGSYRDSEGREFIRLDGQWYVAENDKDKPLHMSDEDMEELYGPLELLD